MYSSHGYIAISSVLVISVVLLIISTSISLLSINDIQSALSTKKGDEALVLVEGCAEDALLRLNETDALPSTITLPEGNCTVTLDSHTGNEWLFTIIGTFMNHQKSIQIRADRDTRVTIINWNEL